MRRKGVYFCNVFSGIAKRNWFVGFFMDKESPLYDPWLELKFSRSKKGRSRTREDAQADGKKRTIQLFIRGHVRTSFLTDDGPDQHCELRKLGDMCLWEPDDVHYWEILRNSLILTVRWPATVDNPNDPSGP